MKAAAIALSAALAFAAASSVALAAKKHHGGGLPVDPREAYLIKTKSSALTWCSIDPSCNGWNKYWDGFKNHVKYAPHTTNLM